jgi:membrane protein implicated in regulation of membrane protease activity
LWTFALGKGFAARRLPVETGVQTMIGQEGEVRAPGLVFVDGALWQAHTADDSELVPGEHVEVQAVDGLRLTVRK